jgi:hypothetical protein
MTEEYICHVEDCNWAGDSLASLRSHVSGSKDTDHQQARRNKAWEGWYPEAAGVVPSEEGGSDPSAAGRADPADDDPSEGDGAETGDSDPAEGGADPTEEYAEQWGSDESGRSTQQTEGGEGGSDPSDEGDDGGSNPSSPEGNGIGAGAALAAGSLLVGLLAVLTRDSDEEPIEVESTAEDVDPEDEGADGGVDLSGWEGAYE